MAIAFDTLEYARRLREAGFSEQQAEGQARALAAVMTDSLATKQDLQHVEDRIDALEKRIDERIDTFEKHLDIRFVDLEKRFELRLQTGLADLERRMTFRLGAMMVASIGAASALTRMF